ncbi:MAG: FAD-dependent oxidoreductase [Burkholderiaceae bacterium]
MKNRIIVLGAGMVGTCTALQLQTRGFEVILIDRRSPGLETSYGNAGLIQQEAVEPYAMPRDVGFLMKSALGLGAEVSWHANAIPGKCCHRCGGISKILLRQSTLWLHKRTVC